MVFLEVGVALKTCDSFTRDVSVSRGVRDMCRSLDNAFDEAH